MLLTKDRRPDIRLPDVDVKLPDIDLPDIKLSDLKKPDIKLSDLKPDIDLSKVDLSKVDLGQARSDVERAIASAVRGTPLERRSQPTRWPLAVVGLITAMIAMWVIVTNESVRYAVMDAWNSARRWFEDQWSNLGDRANRRPIEPVAFDAAQTAPMRDDMPGADPLYTGMSDYPDGLGSDDTVRKNGDAVEVR